MNYINFDDVQRQLEAAGLILDKDLRIDGRIQRWRVSGEDNERRGWSRLRDWQSRSGAMYVVGAFGVWQGTDDGYTKVEIALRDDGLGKEERKEQAAAIRAANAEARKRMDELRKGEAQQAGRWAAQVWAHCEAAPADHEYLVRKGIGPNGTRVLRNLDGLLLPGIDESNHWRLSLARGALVVPMHDAHGNVCGVQFVYPAGHARKKDGRDKEFWPSGMAMGGSFGLIGPLRREGVMLVAEGFATAATLHEATGMTVAYAFSANNLGRTGKALRKTCARARLLFCADDDYLTEGNPGCAAAAQACAELEHASWVKPGFAGDDGQDLRAGKKLTDFNDLAKLAGSNLRVGAQIAAALDALGWREAGARADARDAGGEGGGPPERKRARAVMSLDEIVERFVPLDDGTGKHVWDAWTNRVVQRDQMVQLLPAGVRADDIKRHPVWVERGAHYLDEVGFDPSGKDATVRLNTWRGWPMQPKAGKCELLLDLLRHLCSEEPRNGELFTWLLRWMAYPLQRPGAKMASAVIMHGPQGTGKSCVFQALAKIYGPYSTVLNQRGLEDRFNSDWADSKLFILAEEVVTRAEMWHIKNELKELVSGEWIRINPKNIAAYRQRNQVNIVYLSNENQPLPLENDDRRHLVIYTPPPLSEAYYDEVFVEIENGGIEAFYDYLLRLDLGDFHPKKRPPMTEAKQALILLSAASEARFAAEYLLGELDLPVCPSLAMDFYGGYLRWCRLNGEPRPRASNVFLGAVSRLTGWEKRKCRVLTEAGAPQLRPMIFPPLQSMQAHGTAQPEGGSQQQWLTESAQRFRQAVHGPNEGGKWGG